MDFPGTITVRPETLKEYVKDVVSSLLAHGFRKPVLLDGHGGNYGILDLLAEDIHLERGALISHVRSWDIATLPIPAEAPSHEGHGGVFETSIMMYLCPDDVDSARFIPSSPEIELTAYGSVFPPPSSLLSRGAAVIPLSMTEMVKDGHHGDPSLAHPERGRALLEVKTDALVNYLTALKDNRIRTRAKG
jgi:creatinine amidohydrolase